MTYRYWNVEERTLGSWTWKPEVLRKKIIEAAVDECWGWSGSTSTNGHLFGAKRHGRPQMTQAARLWFADYYNCEIEDLAIKHTCGNKFCMNIAHMAAQPNQMRFRRDGTDIKQVNRSIAIPEYRGRRIDNWWAPDHE